MIDAAAPATAIAVTAMKDLDLVVIRLFLLNGHTNSATDEVGIALALERAA